MRQSEVSVVTPTDSQRPQPSWLRLLKAIKPPVIIAIAVLLASVITLFGLQPRLHELLRNGWSAYQTFTSPTTAAYILLILEVVLAALYFSSAIVLINYQPNKQIVFMLALGFVIAGLTLPGMSDALIKPEHSNLADYFRVPVLSARALGLILELVLFYTFPDGRFVPNWTRLLAMIWAILNVLWLLNPEMPFNPIYGPTWRATPVASFVVHIFFPITGLLSQIYRYRHVADQVQRQQLKWTATAVLVSIIGGAIYYGSLAFTQGMTITPGFVATLFAYGRPLSQIVLMALIPMYCLFVAVQRYHLWQIDTIFNRTLVYSSLTLAVITVYVVTVGALGALFEAEHGNLSISLVATGLVAVLFHPLREYLQRIINRLMFGKRDDPLGVMGELGKQIEAAVSPESLLPSVVAMVAQTLRLPYVALEATNSDDQKRRTAQIINASYGVPTDRDERVRFPLVVQGQQIGTLSVALRGGQQSLSVADKRILQTIAAQISSIVQALRLTADLQESRQRIVAAREEERRRLRRDLHDSVGPMLATLSLQTEAARDLITIQPQQSDALLGDVLIKLQAVLGDIRRVVYGLRPPALDDLGLASALHEQIALYRQGGVNIYVTIAEPLPVLSAATEVAIYRIAQEALTNMRRHSSAHNCTLTLAVDQAQKLILLDVSDDGRGFTEDTRSGVGLYSMHERAAELSGTCTIITMPGKGTNVKVVLPW